MQIEKQTISAREKLRMHARSLKQQNGKNKDSPGLKENYCSL